MKTIIEGVEITPAIAEILKKWFIFNPNIEDFYPEYYVTELSDMQDYFCRKLDDTDIEELAKIKHMLLIIIALKDDMKLLIPKKGGDNETQEN